MRISLAEPAQTAFSKWTITHQPGSNDDDQPGGATPIAITAPEIR